MPERQPGKEEWANSNQDMVNQPQPRRPRENSRQPEAATRDWSDEDEETSRERTPKVYFNKPQRPGMGTLQPQISTSWTGRDDQLLYGSPPNVSALQTKTSSSESVLTVRQANLGSQWPKTQDNDLNLFTSPEHGGMLVEPKNPGSGSSWAHTILFCYLQPIRKDLQNPLHFLPILRYLRNDARTVKVGDLRIKKCRIHHRMAPHMVHLGTPAIKARPQICRTTTNTSRWKEHPLLQGVSPTPRKVAKEDPGTISLPTTSSPTQLLAGNPDKKIQPIKLKTGQDPQIISHLDEVSRKAGRIWTKFQPMSLLTPAHSSTRQTKCPLQDHGLVLMVSFPLI
jgi:hypothetical protein